MPQPEPTVVPPDYLEPYLRAARTHSGRFESLLWASPRTQAARFDAMAGACDFAGRSVLDVGCGRADLLPYLLDRRIVPADYLGIEAVSELADVANRRAAEARSRGVDASILRADFLKEPARLFVGADVVAISGSLNTADDALFYPALRRAFDAAAEVLVFNFLRSAELAAGDYLYWRSVQKVERFAREITPAVRVVEGYIAGDCTIAMWHASEPFDAQSAQR